MSSIAPNRVMPGGPNRNPAKRPQRVSARDCRADYVDRLDRFQRHQVVEWGLSRNTVMAYRRDLLRFGTFLNRIGVERLEMIDPTLIQRYLIDLTDSGYRDTTIARHVVAIRMFLKWLHSAGDLADDVTTLIDSLVADWTAVPVSGQRFDTLVTNPPFAKSGKRYRRHFIDTLILDAHKLVVPGGRLLFIHSSMADVPRSLALMADCGMDVAILQERDGPFRDYYFEDPSFVTEAARVPGGYTVRGGVHYERLTVFEARLPD